MTLDTAGRSGTPMVGQHSAVQAAESAVHESDTHRRRQAVLDVESIALVVGGVAFAVCMVPALLFFGRRDVPVQGAASLGEFVAVSSAVVAAVSFAAGRLVGSRGPDDGVAGLTRARYLWIDLIALAFAHGAIALLGWTGAATIMEYSFVGATVYATPAAVIASAAVALSAYAAFLSGSALSPRQLSRVLALFLVIGMITAMLSASDPQWWRLNLSALGITHDVSALTFNLTLIVSGVIVTTIARFGTASLPASTVSERQRREIVRALFVLLGVMLACVGIFPVDRFFLLHNSVATGMIVAFGVLVIGAPWLLRSLSSSFIILGFVFVAAIIGLVFLFAVGTYNLTAVELVASLLIFAWIILFLRNVKAST